MEQEPMNLFKRMLKALHNFVTHYAKRVFGYIKRELDVPIIHTISYQ